MRQPHYSQVFAAGQTDLAGTKPLSEISLDQELQQGFRMIPQGAHPGLVKGAFDGDEVHPIDGRINNLRQEKRLIVRQTGPKLHTTTPPKNFPATPCARSGLERYSTRGGKNLLRDGINLRDGKEEIRVRRANNCSIWRRRRLLRI